PSTSLLFPYTTLFRSESACPMPIYSANSKAKLTSYFQRVGLAQAVLSTTDFAYANGFAGSVFIEYVVVEIIEHNAANRGVKFVRKPQAKQLGVERTLGFRVSDFGMQVRTARSAGIAGITYKLAFVKHYLLGLELDVYIKSL